jgi:hypothetical protein
MSIGTPAGQLIIENATVLTNNINVQDKIGVATNSPQYNLDVHGTANVGVLSALNIVGDGGLLSNIASNLQEITKNGNVTSNTVQFTNTDVGIVATGNIQANYFVGDGSLLSNVINDTELASNIAILRDEIDANVEILRGEISRANTISFSNVITGFTVDSNIVISGNVTAGRFLGDGGLISNIASNLQQITDNGNVTSNTVQFINPTTAFVTDPSSSVGLKLDQLSNVVITSPPQADQLLVYDGSNWINDFNLHNFIKVYNDTGSTLYRGNTVYIVNSHNQNVANVALARSDSNTTMPAIGLIHEDVLNGQEGSVVAYGKVDGINTTGYTEGQTVYVSNTSAGNIMNTKPYGLDDKIQNVGICIKVHANNGVVFVTGVGRSNDIPNAPISSAPNYVYVNETNNDMKKIEPENLLTKLQTLEQVVNTGNVVSNVIQVTGLTTTDNVSIGGNVSMAYSLTVGANDLFVDTATSNVGIGTSTPTYKLDVDGDINLSTGSTLRINGTPAVFSNWTVSGSDIYRSSGNIGIGTTTPTEALDVNGVVKQQNIPAFRVQLTDGSIAGTGVIDYNTVLYDNMTSYSTATGRFTAPVTGHYFFSAHGICLDTRTIYDFTVNGTRQQINSLVDASSADYAQCSISAVLYLTKDQYVSVYQAEGSTYGESTTSNHNLFSGFFIG